MSASSSVGSQRPFSVNKEKNLSMRTNVLLICTDQHRYDALGTSPGSPAITPNLERLAGEGVIYDRCYTTNPVCSPARASLLTGQYPSAHGLWANGVTLPDPSSLVTRELAADSYRCGLVGKFHLAAAFQGTTEERLDDGFEFFRWAHDPFHGSPENAYHAWLRERFPDLWASAEESRVTPKTTEFKHANTAFDTMPTEAHYSTWVTEEACEFLGSTPADRPFFLQVNFFDPHHPFAAPPEYLAKYPPGSIPAPVGSAADLANRPAYQTRASDCSYAGHGPSYPDFSSEELDLVRRTYFAMVSLVDDCVGTILDALRGSGREDDTLVVFTSDHGEMLGDHALLLKGAMMYEQAVRVPMIVRWPGQLRGGCRSDALVGLLDIATTIREATALPTSPKDQGISLRDVVKNPGKARPYALTQYRDSGYPDERPVHTTMYRTDRYKMIVVHGWLDAGTKPEGELYDLAEDPDELVNQWSDPRFAGIRSELYAGMVEALVNAEDRSAIRVKPW